MSTVTEYWAVFFNVILPMNWQEAEYKKINWATYNNLIDGFPGKVVELVDANGKTKSYSVESVRTYYHDSKMFVICDIKKI